MRPLGDSNIHFWRAQNMARITQVDLVAATACNQLTQDGWAQMVSTCRGCSWDHGCQRWLTAHRRDQACDAPDTCDNLLEFNRLKQALKGH